MIYIGLNIHATMRIARAGDAAATIRDVAASTGCGSFHLQAWRAIQFVGRFLLGSTVERLARTLPQHLLVVRNRTRALISG